MKEFKIKIFEKCDIYLAENIKNGKIDGKKSSEIINKLTDELINFKSNSYLKILENLVNKFPKLKIPLFKLMEEYDD